MAHIIFCNVFFANDLNRYFVKINNQAFQCKKLTCQRPNLSIPKTNITKYLFYVINENYKIEAQLETFV